MVLALGAPALVIIILLVGLIVAARRPAPPRPKLCPDCFGWGNDRYNEGAICPTCSGSGMAP
jgi:hypothetical protein